MLQKSVDLYYKGEFPPSILINGIPFSRNGTRYIYQSTKNINDNSDNFIYIKVLNEEGLQESLPSEVKLNNEVFIHRFGPFFTLKNSTEREVGKFFDSISSTYRQVISPELNKVVIYYLIRSIINKKKNSLNKFRMLDFGIGIGISDEVIKNKFQSTQIVLYGLEVSDKVIKICKDKGMEVKKKNGLRIPYSDNYFDGVILSFVTGYFSGLASFRKNFLEIIRILKPLGIVTFNLHKTEWKSINSYQRCLSQTGFSLGIPKIQKTKIGKDYEKIVILEAQKKSK